MRITIFGIIWMIILVFVFFKNKAKYMVEITLFSMVMQQASVIFMGEQGIGPQLFTSVAMIIWSISHSKVWDHYTVRLHRGNYVKFFCCLAMFGFVLGILVSRQINLNAYTIDNVQFILLFFQLLIYMCCFLSIWNLNTQMTTEEAENIFIKLTEFVVIIGILQMLAQMNILPIKAIMNTIIYSSSTALDMSWRYPRVFSTFMEPSYCSPFLVGAFYYIVSLGKNTKKYIVLEILLVCMIISTFSSTAYGTFAIIGLLYLVISKNKKALKYLIPLGGIAILILLITGQLSYILNEVIFTKMNTGSAWTRGSLDKYCYKMFQKSMIWGNGYKNIRGSQFLKSLAAQLGMMGCICWFLIWIPFVIYSLVNRQKRIVGIVLYLLSVVCAMFIAIPDVDIIVFWGMMYFLAITLNTEKRREQYEIVNNYSNV